MKLHQCKEKGSAPEKGVNSPSSHAPGKTFNYFNKTLVHSSPNIPVVLLDILS